MMIIKNGINKDINKTALRCHCARWQITKTKTY